MAKRNSNQWSIGDALEAFLNRNGLKEESIESRIRAEWENIVGKPVARHTRTIQLKEGVLTLTLEHPVWREEVRHIAPTLPEKINALLEGNYVVSVRIF